MLKARLKINTVYKTKEGEQREALAGTIVLVDPTPNYKQFHTVVYPDNVRYFLRSSHFEYVN